jgi:exosortase/archaeosortase family protein
MRTCVQWTVLIVAIFVAYSYSLSTLLQSAGLETPLAYVSLVPLIALGIAAVKARPTRPEPAFHDRQVDYIVGVPLILLALVITKMLPGRFSAMFWVWRLDLVSFPFFVAGAVAIIFGTRVLWRQKLAIAYLLLAWPLPYTVLLLSVLNAFTALTLAGLRTGVHLVPVATPVPGSSDNSLFNVVHHGHAFTLSVVSACSGVNGIVGFLLVGIAFGAVVKGPIVRKCLWLAGGMVLLWLINVGRLLFIFWAGGRWGEHVAIDVLHPFVGLLTFSGGVLVMVLLLGPLGLHIGDRTGPSAAASGVRRAAAVPKVFAAVAVLVASALVIGAADLGLRTYNLVADASGAPKLVAYRVAPVGPTGWTVRQTASYDWAQPLFGADSSWLRYEFLQSPGSTGDLHSDYGVTMDVINSGDLESFAAYGVEACYQFHGFALRDVAQVKLAGGVTGQSLSYTAQGQSWSIVYWIVPVKTSGGGVRYERVVLYLLNSPVVGSGVHLPKGTNLQDIAGGLGRSGVDRQLITNRSFLVAFADELLHVQASPVATRLALATPVTAPAPSPAATGTGSGAATGTGTGTGGSPSGGTGAFNPDPFGNRKTAFVTLAHP